MNNHLKKLNVAVIGLGVGEQHARTYQKIPQCNLIWLHDLDYARAEKVSRDLGVGGIAGHFDQILDDPNVDIVSIATYDADHFSQVTAALKAGKHVFVEKPICRTVSEAKKIYDVWQQSGGPVRALASNLVLRAAPLYLRLRKTISDGLLGRVYSVDGEYLYGRLYKITQGWRGYEENYSVMAGGGVHMIDLILWLTGSRPLSIQAVGNRISTEGSIFRYNDFVTATGQLSDSAVVRFTANYGCVHQHQHVLRVYGTQGTFLYDDAGARVHYTRDPDSRPDRWPESPLPASKGELIPDFIQGILNGRNWSQTVQTCLDAVSICAACEEALKQNKQIKVEYP